jgi:hypothetical protein
MKPTLAETLLDSMTPRAAAALEQHFFGKIGAVLAGATATPRRARGKRQQTSDGRSVSQVIRDFDVKHPDSKASVVVAHCAKLGLTVAPQVATTFDV